MNYDFIFVVFVFGVVVVAIVALALGKDQVAAILAEALTNMARLFKR